MRLACHPLGRVTHWLSMSLSGVLGYFVGRHFVYQIAVPACMEDTQVNRFEKWLVLGLPAECRHLPREVAAVFFKSSRTSSGDQFVIRHICGHHIF